MNFKLDRALKSALLVGALAVGASPAAFADFTQTDINALTPGLFSTGDNGSLSFNLYSTNTDAGFYSLTQNLGLTFNQIFSAPNTAGDVDANLDQAGMTLTWTIGNFGSGTAATNFANLLASGQLAWTVAAQNVGSAPLVDSMQLATTVDQAQTFSGPTATGVTSSVLTGLTSTALNTNYNNYNADSALNPLAILTAAGPGYNGPATLNPGALDTSTGVGGTLNFYGFSNNVGTSAAADYFQYAGTWAFNIVNGIGQLVYSVGGGSSEVPLPAAVWLLLSGLAGVGVIGRRKPAAELAAA